MPPCFSFGRNGSPAIEQNRSQLASTDCDEGRPTSSVERLVEARDPRRDRPRHDAAQVDQVFDDDEVPGVQVFGDAAGAVVDEHLADAAAVEHVEDALGGDGARLAGRAARVDAVHPDVQVVALGAGLRLVTRQSRNEGEGPNGVSTWMSGSTTRTARVRMTGQGVIRVREPPGARAADVRERHPWQVSHAIPFRACGQSPRRDRAQGSRIHDTDLACLGVARRVHKQAVGGRGRRRTNPVHPRRGRPGRRTVGSPTRFFSSRSSLTVAYLTLDVRRSMYRVRKRSASISTQTSAFGGWPQRPRRSVITIPDARGLVVSISRYQRSV